MTCALCQVGLRGRGRRQGAARAPRDAASRATGVKSAYGGCGSLFSPMIRAYSRAGERLPSARSEGRVQGIMGPTAPHFVEHGERDLLGQLLPTMERWVPLGLRPTRVGDFELSLNFEREREWASQVSRVGTIESVVGRTDLCEVRWSSLDIVSKSEAGNETCEVITKLQIAACCRRVPSQAFARRGSARRGGARERAAK